MESAAAPNCGGALRIVPVGGFSRREALSYLGSGLTDHPDQRIEALDLGADLDGLPLALAQAAAVMKVSGLGCREYRARLAERHEHLSGVRVDGRLGGRAGHLVARRARTSIGEGQSVIRGRSPRRFGIPIRSAPG
jgi:hypothetical protein